MSLRFAYYAFADDFATALRDKHKPVAHAAQKAIGEAGDIAKQRGRAAIAGAGFSKRWQNALRVNVYPKRGESIDAAALIFSKIGYAGVFAKGATIKGNPLLWIPLPTMPFGRGGRRIPAAKYRQVVGHPLYSIKRAAGKTPLLGANVRATGNRAQKGVSMSMLRRGRNPGGKGREQLIPLYFGVKQVDIEKKFDIRAAAEHARDSLPGLYFRYLQDE